MADQAPETRTTCVYLQAAGAQASGALPYASHRHRCTALGEPRLVAPRTQAAFCLTEQHTTCPYFEAGIGASPAPPAGVPLDIPILPQEE